MDPDAALDTLNDNDAPTIDRDEAALNLLVWIANGGALPLSLNLDCARDGMVAVRSRLTSHCEARLLRLIDRPLPFNMERYV